MKIVIVSLAILACFFLFIAMRNIKQAVPDGDRAYMDPLPGSLRLVWPLVTLFAYYVGQRLPTDMLERYYATMRRSGIGYLMSADEFVGLKLLCAFVGLAAGFLISGTLGEIQFSHLLFGFAVGWFVPSLSVRDRKIKRETQIVRHLPTFLDFLTMAVQAGMNLSGALNQAIDKGPAGPLKIEMSKVTRDIRAGMTRVDALKAMSERLDIREVTTFVTAVAQAEKTGASLGETLKIQADQRRTERFQKAEKKAMEAPVKLIFPLVVFIFPMTFLVLGFPIAMKFMYEL